MRRFAAANAFFEARSLDEALERTGFVQADPIRAPACAQDLILRQRAPGYRVGDLDAWYPGAAVEEGFLYAHGFMPRAAWQLLRPTRPAPPDDFEAAVLDRVAAAGSALPSDLEAAFGRERARNAWGGYSRRATLALDALHRRGLLRVCGRGRGMRRYAPAVPPEPPLPVAERVARLVLRVARTLAPVAAPTLGEAVARLRRLEDDAPDPRAVVRGLVRDGALTAGEVDGLLYLWPADLAPPAEGDPDGPPRARFLAPFDPFVWDRRRFEHLHGWRYRFEAYVPTAARSRGHYAMPLVYGDAAIGWVNLAATPAGLAVDRGFAAPRPADPAFEAAFDEEVARMETFLRPRGAAEAGSAADGLDPGSREPDPARRDHVGPDRAVGGAKRERRRQDGGGGERPARG